MKERVWLVENVDGREYLVGRMPPDPVTFEVVRVPVGSIKEWPGMDLSERDKLFSFLGIVFIVFVLLGALPVGALFLFRGQVLTDQYTPVFVLGAIAYAVVCVTVMGYWERHVFRRHAKKIEAFCKKYGIEHNPTRVGRLGESSRLEYVLLEEGESL